MKLARSIIAICLALLIMVVTTGFSISQHFCMGELLYSSILGNPDCKMEKEDLPPCHDQDGAAQSADLLSKKNCCEDHNTTVEGQDIPTVLKAGDNLLPSIKFLTAFTYIFFHDYQPPGDKGRLYARYRPPLIQRNIPVLIQSFLI